MQPNTSKAAAFAETLLASGGVEMLLSLLRRETEFEEALSSASSNSGPNLKTSQDGSDDLVVPDEEVHNGNVENIVGTDSQGSKIAGEPEELPSPRSPPVLHIHKAVIDDDTQLPLPTKTVLSVARSRSAAHKSRAGGNLGGIELSISADRVRNKFRNMDFSDGIMVGIVSLFGSLVSGGHLKVMRFGTAASQLPTTSAASGNNVAGEGPAGVASAAVVWLLYALERAFQASPRRLLTVSVYAALLPAVIRSEVRNPVFLDEIDLAVDRA